LLFVHAVREMVSECCLRAHLRKSDVATTNGKVFPSGEPSVEGRNVIDTQQILVFGINSLLVKGLVHPKMKILSVFTHPHVVPTP